jgi:hypothetical protein
MNTHATLVPSTSIRMRHSILTMCSLSRWNPPLESFNNWMWRLLITRSTTKAIERGRHHLDVYKRRFKKKRLTDLSRRSICNPELETRQHSLATRNAMIWSSPYDQYVSKTKRIKVLRHADVRRGITNKTKNVGMYPMNMTGNIGQ